MYYFRQNKISFQSLKENVYQALYVTKQVLRGKAREHKGLLYKCSYY
jgi:hypothetical protein